MFVGGGLLVVGLLIVAIAILNFPSPNSDTSRSTTVQTIGANGYFEAVVEPPAGPNAAASLTIAWAPTGTIEGFLVVPNCQGFSPPQVPQTQCIYPGASGTNGHIVVAPITNFPYIVYLVNPSSAPISTSISIAVEAQSNGGLTLWEATAVIFAGIILSCMGAISLFLGYFLKGNPYAGRAPPTIDEILDEKRPEDEPEAKGESAEVWDDALPKKDASEEAPKK